MSEATLFTVMVVDDHPVVRSGLRALLEESGRFTVVGEAADGDEALTMAESLEPELVVMDVLMPGKNGIDACRDIIDLLPDTRVMMLTAAGEEDAVIDAVAAGATGYLQKYARPEEFVNALLKVAEGTLQVPDAAVKRVFAMLRGQEQWIAIRPIERLTEIERETLTQFTRGSSYREIAKARGNSVVTVRNTLYRIQDKLGIETKQELVVWAVRNGLLNDVPAGSDPPPA